MIIQVDLFR